MKHAVQRLVKEKSEKKANIDEAVLRLANSAVMEEQVNKEHLMFHKQKWEHNKEYIKSKLEAKYQYRKEVTVENKEGIVLQLLKEDCDTVIQKCKE